ncbi:hypothetical protein LV779_19295 [Streptomyces thinghirensis]|nr:hypothetical protein [Streptomyces thinghirensis]
MDRLSAQLALVARGEGVPCSRAGDCAGSSPRTPRRTSGANVRTPAADGRGTHLRRRCSRWR